MRRVWATMVSVWATLAIVAALAWTRQPPPRALVQQAPTTLVVKGKNGTTQRLIVLGSTTSATPHATTQTSPVPVG
jgi:cyanate permease